MRKTGAWDSSDHQALRPMPCNRLDRFTSGIVIFAKTWDAMRMINQKIQHREIEKRYRCVVIGRPRPKRGKIENYLLKNQKETIVSVHESPVPGSQYACMEYRIVEVKNHLSLLDCRLVTGRTHQIRAQLAYSGVPILGDMRYGNKQMNRKCKKYHQELCASQITFSFPTDAGVLNYLRGKTYGDVGNHRYKRRIAWHI